MGIGIRGLEEGRRSRGVPRCNDNNRLRECLSCSHARIVYMEHAKYLVPSTQAYNNHRQIPDTKATIFQVHKFYIHSLTHSLTSPPHDWIYLLPYSLFLPAVRLRLA